MQEAVEPGAREVQAAPRLNKPLLLLLRPLNQAARTAKKLLVAPRAKKLLLLRPRHPHRAADQEANKGAVAPKK